MFADINLEAAKDAAMASSEFATNPNYSELSLAVDVTDISSVISMVETCLERYGRIDYLVNSAGLGVSIVLFRFRAVGNLCGCKAYLLTNLGIGTGEKTRRGCGG